MKSKMFLFVAVVLVSSIASAEQYSISNPTEPIPSPVRVVGPIEGEVQVTNFPEIQEIRGEVQLVVEDLLQVQVSNPLEFPETINVEGVVEIDDEKAVRVAVQNFPKPDPPPTRSFAAFVAKGDIDEKNSSNKQTFQVPKGKIFQAYRLTIFYSPDLLARVNQ